MKVIKLVVDKLPKNCRKCLFYRYVSVGINRCIITKDNVIMYTGVDGRPSQCPLVVERSE